MHTSMWYKFILDCMYSLIVQLINKTNKEQIGDLEHFEANRSGLIGV